MAEIELYYFNTAGRGELLRLLLVASGKPWKDVRFSMDEWNDKYKACAPFGQAPYMKYNGKLYGQSMAIASFLAREFGMAGESNLQALRIEEVMGLVQDLMKCLVNVYYEQDDTKKKEQMDALTTKEIPRVFGAFQNLLEGNGNTGHFVGTKLSLADIAVYDLVTSTEKWLQKNLDGSYQAIRTLKHKVEDNQHIKTYLNSQATQQAKA